MEDLPVPSSDMTDWDGMRASAFVAILNLGR
jgi:hypothetical protein